MKGAGWWGQFGVINVNTGEQTRQVEGARGSLRRCCENKMQ